MKKIILILISLCILVRFSQGLPCGDNPAFQLFNDLVKHALNDVQFAIDNPIPNQKPPKDNAPKPEEILKNLTNLQATLLTYNTSSSTLYTSSIDIGHCSSLFTVNTDQICCNSDILKGISQMIKGKGHAFGRNRPKIVQFLKKAGKIVQACTPAGTLPPEDDPEGTGFSATKEKLFQCQLQSVLAQVRFFRGLSCALCVPPSADYSSSSFFSTTTQSITVDGKSYNINQFKVTQSSYDEYLAAIANGTQCITDFANTLIDKFTAALPSFANTDQCTKFKTKFEAFLADPELIPCDTLETCKTFCSETINENPFHDGCAGIGMVDEQNATATANYARALVAAAPTTLVTGNTGFNAQVANAEEDGQIAIDDTQLTSQAKNNRILLFSLVILASLLAFAMFI